MSPSTPTEWKPASPGTQLPPLPANPYPYPLYAWDLVAIEKFNQGKAQADCYHANQNLAADYISGPFARFMASYSIGRTAPDAQPPAPPMALVVQAAGPSEDGSLGLHFDFVPGNTPVCDVPAYQHQPAPTPPPPPPTTVDVGDVIQAEPPTADGMSVGTRITGPDGGTYVKMARNLPFGTVYLWYRVK